MPVTLHQLECFHAVAYHGGFTAASHKPPLMLGRASLYEQVARLQRELGVRLYEVSGRRIHLTAIGHLLFRELHPPLVALRSLPSLTNPGDVGEITVAFTPITVHWIAPTLGRYRKEFPRVRITMIDRMTPEIWELVARGAVDLAVAPPPSSVTLPVKSVLLGEDPMVLVVSRMHHLARRTDSIRLQDLTTEPLIAIVKGSIQRANLDAAFAREGISPQWVIETSTPAVIGLYASLGVGVGVTSYLAIAADVTRKLVVIPAAHIFGTVQIGILTNGHRHLSPAARAFMELLRGDLTQRFDEVHALYEGEDRHPRSSARGRAGVPEVVR